MVLFIYKKIAPSLINTIYNETKEKLNASSTIKQVK
jgi:hypothetical protein